MIHSFVEPYDDWSKDPPLAKIAKNLSSINNNKFSENILFH